jgi:uncharacterized protein involved in exopolysaccharide biosynthesis
LEERLAEETKFIDELPDNMIELARLRRDAEINEQLYLTISQQYAETALVGTDSVWAGPSARLRNGSEKS